MQTNGLLAGILLVLIAIYIDIAIYRRRHSEFRPKKTTANADKPRWPKRDTYIVSVFNVLPDGAELISKSYFIRPVGKEYERDYYIRLGEITWKKGGIEIASEARRCFDDFDAAMYYANKCRKQLFGDELGRKIALIHRISGDLAEFLRYYEDTEYGAYRSEETTLEDWPLMLNPQYSERGS